MCGMCGIFEPGAEQGALEHSVRRMVRTIAHRGPDAEGVETLEDVALGHRRLSILDLSPTGAQPMTYAGVWITYNGEVYNFQELRANLESRGHHFRGHSDTEVILHTYAEYGLDGLAALEGIFSIALWDPAARRIVLMRDRLGVKPLFYGWQGARLVFGSEIKAVLAGGVNDRSIDAQALSEHLWFGNAFEDRTIFRHVKAVPPGHRLVVEHNRPRLEAWWRLEDAIPDAPRHLTAEQAAIEVREVLDAAVTRQLVADVPVGLFLSGGVDSSSIAASAMRDGGRPLSSFAVGFDYDRGVNELPKARQVADHLGLDHHEVRVTAPAIETILEKLVRAHDEPFADAANLPLYLLAQSLNGTVKVVLQGDGGDELFAGYRRYKILRHTAAWRLWPSGLTGLAVRRGGAAARFGRMAAAAGASDPAMRMALLLTVETLVDPPTAVMFADARHHLEEQTDPFAAYRRCAERFRRLDPVSQMLATDLSLQLPSQFLAKVDRATMAHGLEARVPLLDERVLALALRLPVDVKLKGGRTKAVLRDAMRPRLPAVILDGPKTGFGVPYEYWVKGPLHQFARAAILDSGFAAQFGFDRTKLERTLNIHRDGVQDRGFLIWKLLQLSLWKKAYLG
jgi:asparagine synthase (glutamine-hydrolysing)